MFNLYMHEKRFEEHSRKSNKDLSLETRAKLMKQRNEVMSQKYRTRVGQFIREVSNFVQKKTIILTLLVCA